MAQKVFNGNRLQSLIESPKIVVLFLQITSLTTTVVGARIILGNLPGYTYIIFGCGIQFFLLWLFTAGKSALRSRSTLWALATVYTLFSIYTSFFSLYEGISGKQLSPTSYALQASLGIDEAISTDANYKNDLKKYKAENEKNKSIRDMLREYCEYHCQSASPPQKIALMNDIKESDNNLADLNRIGEFEKFQGLRASNFNLNNKSFTAEEIDSENRKIINLFIDNIKNKDKRISMKHQRDQSTKQNFFLLPFEKLAEGDINAIFALLIAFVIDSTSILVGINPDKVDHNKFKSISQSLHLSSIKLAYGIKVFIPELLTNIGHTLFGIIRALPEPFNGTLLGFSAGFQRLSNIILPSCHSFSITGSRQDFLINLSESIEYVHSASGGAMKYRINYKRLMFVSQNNKDFRHGYDILIRRLELLNWLSRVSSSNEPGEVNEILYTINNYKPFHKWYLAELNKNFSEERHDVSSGYSFKTKINLPRFSVNGH